MIPWEAPSRRSALVKSGMFENLREDWVMHERDISRPGLWVMVVYRFGRWRYRFKYKMSARRCLRFTRY